MKASFVLLFMLQILLITNVSEGTPVYGWGKNDYGQLGLGTNTDVFEVTYIPYYTPIDVESINVGQDAHFITSGTNIYSCGSNAQGQLGQGVPTVDQISIPDPVVGLTGSYDVYSLPRATIAYSRTQKTIFGWGFAAGYVAGYSTGAYNRVQPVVPGVGLEGNIENVSTANGAIFLFLTNGTIFTAGVSSNGVFGLGNSNPSPQFKQMTFWRNANINVLQIFTTQATTVFAQTGNYSIFGWGSNSYGQLGLGHQRDLYTPTRIAYFDTEQLYVSQIKQGQTHTIALTCGGRVFGWGSNQRGQLATGTSDLLNHTTPREILFPQNGSIVEIVAGAYHTFARTASNQWYFWGMGDTGVSGLGDTEDIFVPLLADIFTGFGINHIESGSYSTFAMGWNVADAPTSPPDCPENWNVNECTAIIPPCGPNMLCSNTERSYRCTCLPGYQNLDGDNACEDINECLKSPCLPQAKCNNTIGSFMCDCPLGYIGDGLPSGTGCYPTVCGNGIWERGEECDTKLSPSCCTTNCTLLPASTTCRPSTVPCEVSEYCDGLSQYCPADDWSDSRYCPFCGNGICDDTPAVNGTESCSTCPGDCGTCDSCTKIVCNGKCADSPLDCRVECEPRQFACASGKCVDDFVKCATNDCSKNSTECWDGSCANSLKECPTVPACPLLSKRCYGRCIDYAKECDVSLAENCTKTICLNGKCASECEQYNGCATHLIRCPSGECTADFSVCKGDCGDNLYLCGDKTCNFADNCTTLLRFETAIPFTKHISANVDATVGVVSQSGIAIVALNVIGGTFKGNTPVDVAPESFSLLNTLELPKAWGNNTRLEDNIFSSAISFKVPDKTKFAKNITVVFNIAYLPPGVNSSTLCLGFVNDYGKWDCASTVTCDNSTCTGETPHFTSFGLITSVHPPVFNSLDSDDINVFKHITEGNVIIYVYCGLVIIFSVLYVWAFHADKEAKYISESVHKTEEYEYEEEPRAKNRKSSTPEGPPNSVSVILTANRSRSPGSTAPLVDSSSTISNSQSIPTDSPVPPTPSAGSPTPQPFANGEMGVVAPPQGRPRARTLIAKEAAQQRFTTKHKWLSIYFTARIENLTRVSRVTILLSMILTNMCVASVLFNAENRSSIGQRILVGFIGSMIGFVMSFAIFTMFKLVPKTKRFICYTVSVIYILGTGFLTLWYNLLLETSVAYGWCVSVSIGVAQDALLNEPLKIILVSLLIGLFPHVGLFNKL